MIGIRHLNIHTTQIYLWMWTHGSRGWYMTRQCHMPLKRLSICAKRFLRNCDTCRRCTTWYGAELDMGLKQMAFTPHMGANLKIACRCSSFCALLVQLYKLMWSALKLTRQERSQGPWLSNIFTCVGSCYWTVHKICHLKILCIQGCAEAKEKHSVWI